MMIKDITGQKFNKLLVLSFDEERNKLEKERMRRGEIKNPKLYYICKCDCGNISTVEGNSIRSGRVKSCGCLQKERTSISNKKQNSFEFLEDGIVKGWDFKHENYFLISKEDYKEVSKIYWRKNIYGYWLGYDTLKKKTIKLHQFICLIHYKDIYSLDGDLIPDHLNRNKNDNTYLNLQPKQRFENDRNRSLSKNNKTGVKGVYFDDSNKYRKWVAFITNNNHKKLKKCFLTKEEAMSQRREWEKEFNYL